MAFTQLHKIKYMLYGINFFIVTQNNYVIVKIVTHSFHRLALILS